MDTSEKAVNVAALLASVAELVPGEDKGEIFGQISLYLFRS
jgi:hypothetical protein